MARKAVEPAQEQEVSEVHSEFGELAADVQRAYEDGTTIEEAERLAAKFLGAQLKIAEELAQIDLDSRMKKNGLKAIKSAVYMAAATAGEKKPSEGFLENTVNLSKEVCGAQDRFDAADSRKEALSIYLGIFKDAHIYFRGIAKGNYNG
jgi:hypothetical protein